MKPIQGYESFYAVTLDGDIYSYRKGGVLKPTHSGKDPYPFVTLCDGKGGRERLMIHRIVATTRISNPYNLPDVNHKDGDKFNYHPDNLEWCTASDNAFHGYETGLIPTGENHHQAKLTQEQVDYCRTVFKKRHKEFGRSALSKRFGVNPSTISRILNNKTWTYDL